MYIGLHVKYRYCCQILIQLEFFLDRFSKNTAHHENSSSGSRVVPCRWTDIQTDGQTDMRKLIVTFRNFAKCLKPSCFADFHEFFLLSRAKFVRSSVKVKVSRLQLCFTYWKMVVCAKKILLVLRQPLWCDELCCSSLLAPNRATHNR